MKEKKQAKKVISLGIIIAVFTVGIFNMDILYSKVSQIRTHIIEEQQYAYRNEKKEINIAVSSETGKKYNNNNWYECWNIISHSGGVRGQMPYE